jgi:thiamine-monophosphate kinase
VAISEFDLIRQYFTSQSTVNPVTRLGVGDDCALMSVPAGYELAVTVDSMVEGVHFFAGADPEQLGRKLLAVNLSDLAAMGADPVVATLALTLPEADENWLKPFSQGFLHLAKQFSVDLIGGDTTKGHLTLSIQAMGIVPEGQALKRSGAKVGDLIFVTGDGLGDAGLGLKIEQGYLCGFTNEALRKFHTPDPRVVEGMKIRDYASSCIDLSDGMASDLTHILEKSAVGACLDWDKLPVSKATKGYIDETDDWMLPLTAGEDYELCFTVAPEDIAAINIDCTQVGVIELQKGLRINRLGIIEVLGAKGFEHFS